MFWFAGGFSLLYPFVVSPLPPSCATPLRSMKNTQHTLSIFETFRWLLISIALLSSAMADEAAKGFDLSKMSHVSTCCGKQGVIWGGCYGVTDKKQIAYAVFYDGSKPSPFAAKMWFRSSGEKGVELVAEQNGIKINPPSSEENILVIFDDKIMRGKFEPMDEAKFRKFLAQNKEFTLARLEAFSKQAEESPSPKKSK